MRSSFFYKGILFLLCFCKTIFLFAQDGIIKGRVYNDHCRKAKMRLKTTTMKLLLFISMLSFPLYVFPQTNTGNEFGTIKGKISTSDGEPAEFVSVLVKNSGVGTVTDADGNFEIKKIKAGFYHIHVSLQSYADTEITVEVKADVMSFLQVQLHLTYAELKQVIVQTGLHPNYVETKTSESLRLNLPLLEVPQNIVVSTQQLFADQGLTNMTQAFRTVSGVEKVFR